jgi:hypothetical protein
MDLSHINAEHTVQRGPDIEGGCVVLALPRTRQQNLRRQGAIFTHAEIFQPGSRTTSVGSHNRGAEPYGARSILPPAVLSGQVEDGDGDRPQDCSSFILQHTPAWHELQGSRSRPI